MRLRYRVIAAVLAVITFSSILTSGVSAKKFAKQINTNLGISTQYAYEENNPSWLRKFIIKENMLSVDGIITLKVDKNLKNKILFISILFLLFLYYNRQFEMSFCYILLVFFTFNIKKDRKSVFKQTFCLFLY